MHPIKFLKKNWWKLLLVILVPIVLFIILYKSNPEHDIIKEAYIYGYPLVTFDMARKQQTNVTVPDDQHAPMGQVIKMRNFPSVDNRCCAAPNTDTYYTIIWLDVSDEPWVVEIPDMGKRYYMFPFLDGWSEVFFVASPKTTGNSPQRYVVTGPSFTGSVPEGMNQLKSSTGMVWVLGRIYCTGTPEDIQEAHSLQDKLISVPLSAYGKEYTPPVAKVDPKINMVTSVREQVNSLTLKDYFTYLAELLKKNPPRPEDKEIIERISEIGIIPGKDFDASKLPELGQKVDPKLSLLKMVEELKKQHTTNGWLYFTKGVGNFGSDYILRGMANLLGPGWNRPQDAVYPLTQKDSNGDNYDGSKHNYVMRFEKGQLPPAEAFWSITLYDEEFFFVPNSINRYSLAQRDSLITNKDGSIEFFIQSESPGADKEKNWLPAPKGKFYLVMRIYQPRKTPPSILDGSWIPPPVNRIKN